MKQHIIKRIKLKQSEIFLDHQGQLLQEMGYGDWEEEAKQVLQTAQYFSQLQPVKDNLWIIRNVPLSRKPTLWVLENFLEFFRHYTFITTDDYENFRLTVIHHSHLLIDKNFTTLIKALVYFSVHATKAWASGTLPIWKPICDERVKEAFLKILKSCYEFKTAKSKGKPSAAHQLLI